jgi:hypothetical protein
MPALCVQCTERHENIHHTELLHVASFRIVVTWNSTNMRSSEWTQAGSNLTVLQHSAVTSVQLHTKLVTLIAQDRDIMDLQMKEITSTFLHLSI